MNDLRAELEAAIEEAERGLYARVREVLSHYGDLRACLAAWDVVTALPCPASHEAVCGTADALEDEARRLLGKAGGEGCLP